MEDKEKKPFEERLARLNEIVAKVEGEVLPLEQAMALYEEGKALIQSLSKELEEAEAKVAKARAEEGEAQ